MPTDSLLFPTLEKRARAVLRAALFVYVVTIMCPISYWSLASYSDNSWYFAVNYAAAHHLVLGRDLVSTTGPLAYLTLPQDMANNLVQGLAFQAGLWILAMAILWDLFYRAGLPLRNLAFFSVFLGLSALLYQYPQPLGPADLLLTAALILLIHFQLRGGLVRYVTALVMIGVIPLIKFVGLMTVAGIALGLVADRLLHRRPGSWREALQALAIPATITAIGWWATLGSLRAIGPYLKTSLELSGGYSSAMSIVGSPAELVAAFEALLLLAVGIAFLATQNRKIAVFFILLLAIPLLVSFKHGFIRQDAHIIHFFCFVTVGLGLVVLPVSLLPRHMIAAFTAVLLLFGTIWLDNVARAEFRPAIAAVTGVRTAVVVGHVLPLSRLRRMLYAKAQKDFTPDLRLDPEIKAIIGHEAVASLSMAYSHAAIDDLNLVFYPVVLRYSAYTPYLDQLNAAWIRDRGPRFLIFDGQSIDGRHPWMETPAMWAEIYRWYNTRMISKRTLLLERRLQPRFAKFEAVSHLPLRFGEALPLPHSQDPVFVRMHCSLNGFGKLRAWLFRVPEVTLNVRRKDGQAATFRVLPGLLEAPSPANYLPDNVAEFAAVFAPHEIPNFSAETLTLGGPGASAYNADCDTALLRAR